MENRDPFYDYVEAAFRFGHDEKIVVDLHLAARIVEAAKRIGREPREENGRTVLVMGLGTFVLPKYETYRSNYVLAPGDFPTEETLAFRDYGKP